MIKTQNDLLLVANKYKDNLAVDVITRSIRQLKMQAQMAKQQLDVLGTIQSDMVIGYREVSMNQSDFITNAGILSNILFAINCEYGNLAIVLERLGEKVEY